MRRALELRVAESRKDCHLVADIVKRRHYLRRNGWKPKTLTLKYISSLRGVEAGPAGCAGAVVIALLPTNYHVLPVLDLHQCEVLNLARMWRADDLGPTIAPDLTPEMLRRIVKGGRGVRSLRDEWCARKLREGGLRAAPRLLVTYSDPDVGHDGATYIAAGATDCGRAACGKRLFAWALVPELVDPLRRFGAAVAERTAA